MIKTLLLSLLPLALYGQATMVQTTLAKAAGVTDRVIYLTSSSGVSAAAVERGATLLLIDREALRALDASGTVARGVSGTLATSHLAGATVWVGTPELFFPTDPSGACVSANERILPRVVISTGTVWDCTGGLWTARASGGFAAVATSGSYNDLTDKPTIAGNPLRSIVFPFDGGGSALATGKTLYLRIPFTCTIVDWSIGSTTAETVSLKTWKIAAGTALPTVSNSISTSGVSLSTGTAVRSTTLTDFTSTAVTANDWIAASITAVTASQYVVFQLGCQQ